MALIWYDVYKVLFKDNNNNSYYLAIRRQSPAPIETKELKLVKNSLKLKYKYEIITTSSLEFTLYHQEGDNLETLYTNNMYEYRVVLAKNNSTIFDGYLDSEYYATTYDEVYKTTTFIATDGLANLKRVKVSDIIYNYDSSSGDVLISVWDFIRQSLYKVNKSSYNVLGYTLQLYDDNHTPIVSTDNVLESIYINPENFKNNEGVYDDVYKAVEETLKGLSLYLIKHNNTIHIFDREFLTKTTTPNSWSKYDENTQHYSTIDRIIMDLNTKTIKKGIRYEILPAVSELSVESNALDVNKIDIPILPDTFDNYASSNNYYISNNNAKFYEYYYYNGANFRLGEGGYEDTFYFTKMVPYGGTAGQNAVADNVIKFRTGNNYYNKGLVIECYPFVSSNYDYSKVKLSFKVLYDTKTQSTISLFDYKPFGTSTDYYETHKLEILCRVTYNGYRLCGLSNEPYNSMTVVPDDDNQYPFESYNYKIVLEKLVNNGGKVNNEWVDVNDVEVGTVYAPFISHPDLTGKLKIEIIQTLGYKRESDGTYTQLDTWKVQGVYFKDFSVTVGDDELSSYRKSEVKKYGYVDDKWKNSGKSIKLYFSSNPYKMLHKGCYYFKYHNSNINTYLFKPLVKIIRSGVCDNIETMVLQSQLNDVGAPKKSISLTYYDNTPYSIVPIYSYMDLKWYPTDQIVNIEDSAINITLKELSNNNYTIQNE